jgi:uncharacterized membrane protein YgdD (TMEM256/DUF423 family)
MQKFIDALAAFAGLMGAGGVAAAAASAHTGGGARLATVAMILLVHAAAVLALSARALNGGGREAKGNERLWLASALALAFGASLFSADIVLLTLRGARLFPMAAPTGGMTMIAGWLLASAAGLAGFFRRRIN